MDNKTFAKKVWVFFKPFRFYLFVIVGMLIVIQLVGTLSPYLFGKGVDAVIHKNVRLTFIFLAISFLISLFQSTVLYWLKETIELKHLDDHVEKAFSISSINKVFSYSIGQHINEHSGVQQSVVSKGQNALQNLMYNVLYGILPSSLQAIVTLIVLTFFDWKVALMALVFVSIYIDVSLRRNKKFFPKAEQIRKKSQAQSKIQSELYRNATLVIAEGQETKTVHDFDEYAETVTQFSTQRWLTYLTPYYFHKFFLVTGQYLTLGLGVYLILIGQHTVGMFVTLFSWTAAIFGNLAQVMSTQRQILFQVVEIKKCSIYLILCLMLTLMRLE